MSRPSLYCAYFNLFMVCLQ